MRFNVTTVPDEAELAELSFSKASAAALKAADYVTVGDLLHAFSNRSVFNVITKKQILYDIALTVCNPILTGTHKTARFTFLDDDTAVKDQLNASLLMLSAEAQAVLKRFAVTVPEQLGYVLTKSENDTILDAAYERTPQLYEILDRMLRDIYDVYFSASEEYEVNIRGEFAEETYSLEIKDVFREDEFKKFRQFCDDVDAVWIKDLAGLSPAVLRKCIGADEAMVGAVTERCKRIEQGAAAKYAGIRPKSRKTKLTSRAKKSAIDRHRRASYDAVSKPSIYGDNEIASYVFIDQVTPSYMLTGYPLAFSYCDDIMMCCGWEDLLVKVIRFLCKECPEKIDKFVGTQEYRDMPVFLYRSNQAEKVSRPRRADGSLIVETDFRSGDIMNIIKYMIEKCKIPEEEFSITCFCSLKSIIEYYSANDDSTPADNAGTSGDVWKAEFSDGSRSERRKYFEKWLEEEKGFSYMGAQECLASVHTASEWAVKLGITQKNIFDIGDTYKLIRCCEMLLDNRQFVTYERQKNNYDLDAIDLLIEFCMDYDSYEAGNEEDEDEYEVDEDGEEYEDDEDDEEEYEDFSDLPTKYTAVGSRRKNQFISWLADDKNFSVKKAESYVEAIITASSWAMKLSLTSTNFFNVSDMGKLVKMTDKLLANPQFSKYDTSKEMFFTEAIDFLVDYCYENE